MDQQKIGAFLKELRNEKAQTQEQLSETLGVSRRTVSRWETGSNLPDLDLLIELSAYFDVSLRELLAGERKPEQGEPQETALRVADYSAESKRRLTRILHGFFLCGSISFTLFFYLFLFGPDSDTFWYGYLEGLTLGVPFAMVLAGTFLTEKHLSKLRTLKRLSKQG